MLNFIILNVIGLLFFTQMFVTSLFLYFYLKLVCLIAFVHALKTLKAMSVDYVRALKSLEPFFIGRSTLNGLQALFRILGLSLIHISEPTRRVVISYAVFCLKKKQQF